MLFGVKCYFGVKQLTANNSVRTPGSWHNGNVNRNAVTESSDYTAPNTEPGSHVDPLEVSSLSIAVD